MNKKQRTSSARQRILETAEKLFYAEGIRAVGIDRVIAEAGVAKMTLYNHFSSKDELILEVLRYREGQFDLFLKENMASHIAGGMNSLNAFFVVLREWFSNPNFRGCSFINATTELADANHAATQFCTKHKREFREMIKSFIIESEGKKAASAAPAIAIMVEGAIVTAVSEGSPESADIIQDAAFDLISKAKRK